jgi:ectoine hydroxylase-related dioxygenase (phytanoyl-CoA dioxygenase family)
VTLDAASIVTSRLITEAQRQRFDEEGFLVVPDALPVALVSELSELHDQLYAEEQRTGKVAPDGSLSLFGFVLRNDRYLELLDYPTTFPMVWAVLGWNIYMYHCHLDVRPPIREKRVPKWRWHQDGGRMNLDIESETTRPRMAVKWGYFLSDMSEPGLGNFTVIPGSHRWNELPRDRYPATGDVPEGALEIVGGPGSAVFFDRRLWHSRSDNFSETTRKALFIGYTYRWLRPRDDYPIDPNWLSRLSPVRQQLLGAGRDAMSFWGRDSGCNCAQCINADTYPLLEWLRERDLLEPDRFPSHTG